MIDGVMRVYEVCGKKKTNICAVRSVSQYYSDLETIVSTMGFGPCKTVAWQRLQLLESRFQMHKILNSEIEMHQQKAVPHRDFYNVRKVDNHIHHSACMNQKHLLRFIKKKLKTEPEV
jgi:AMP deaminase